MTVAVQSLSASASVSDFNFRLTEAQIDRATGRTIGKATIKGVMDGDPNQLTAGDDVTVIATGETTKDPFEKQLTTAGTLFTGTLYSAKQNEEGIITIEAFDAFNKLQKKNVKLNTSNVRSPENVLIDFLSEERLYGDVSQTLDNATPQTPYVDTEWPGSTKATQWQFGNAERGEPLISVISELLDTLGGYMWVDRNGVLRFEGPPDHTVWGAPLVTEIKTGDEAQETNRVIVEASGADSELGQGASFVSTQTSYNSSTGIVSDNPDAATETITDQNISNTEEADQQSFNIATQEDQRRDVGEITMIGNADIELFDEIYIPEIDYNTSGFGNIRSQTMYSERKFKIDEIQHKINSSDGFLTTLKLSPALSTSYELAGGSELAIRQDYLSAQSNSVKEEAISGNEGSTGFLGDLFGGFL